MNAIPKVEIPTPKMPSPNAYDFYVKAGAAIIPAKPAVDAVYDTEITPKAQWKTRYPTAKKEAWLRQNPTALNLLRQGFQYPCHMPPQRSSSDMRWMNGSRFRALARMLIVQSHARSERGNWKGAAESALDILKFGHDISQGGAMNDYLVGAANNWMGRQELWEILPHLNAAESKSAAQRLEKIIQTRVPYADVLREEKYFGQAGLLEIMRSKEWRTINLKDSSGLGRVSELWQMFKTPRRIVFRDYTEYMDSLVAVARKPYTIKEAALAVPDDIYNQTFAPVFERARWNYARDESGNALLLVALALRAYHLEQNQYPQTLNQLVPRYLKQIPEDPFGGGEPLHYKLTGAEYSLYSIGPDGINNDGRAIEDIKIPKEKRNRFQVKPESKGDMIAGIN